MPATVLVVDDEPPIVEIVHDILESRGYRVLATTEPERALAMLDEDPGPIHLVLTDVMMPSRSGSRSPSECNTGGQGSESSS
jgi:two-component system, cell cycle sensor histidine kinase and response regulator CckA